MADLLLTLGHNASALAISVGDDGMARVTNAYELERLSGVKSDSRFPLDAIIALKERGTETFDRVYVTHWDPMNSVDGLKEKYWDRSVFPQTVQVISQESQGLTHHDCHAHAAIAFAGKSFPVRDSGVLVIDGFGNFAEHISYYRLGEDRKPILIKRFFGYGSSLGLMYQYATAFLGMKMHEDEYKLLGYGSRVNDIGVDREKLNDIAMSETAGLIKALRSGNPVKKNPDLAGLPAVQEEWGKRFAGVLNQAGLVGVDHPSHEARCVVGYVVQKILEFTVRNLFSADIQKPANLIFTGGVAFNVELNRMLLDIVPGKVCAMPLAGDQGNSLGLWAHHNKRATLDFDGLCWGKRDFGPADAQLPDGLHVFAKDGDDVFALIEQELSTTGFVNIVRGKMEFGPRALCNTTTLARADDPAFAAEINRINGRDTVMPFAPVVWHEAMEKVFPLSTRVHKSDRFMVIALGYGHAGEELTSIGKSVPGAALFTAGGHITGRPQSYVPKYPGDSVARIVQAYGLLINTSFNVHGVPICLDMKDVVHSHQYQRQLNPNVRTIVITDTELS